MGYFEGLSLMFIDFVNSLQSSDEENLNSDYAANLAAIINATNTSQPSKTQIPATGKCQPATKWRMAPQALRCVML